MRFRAAILGVFLVASAATSAEPGGADGFAVYREGEDLQETLLAARRRYAAWLSAQPAARRAVVWGHWLATELLADAEAARLVQPREAVDVNATRGDRPLWTRRDDLKDGELNRFIGGAGRGAVVLTRTVRAERPVRLTVGIGGGDHLDVWVNGAKAVSAETRLAAGRYGCSYRYDGTRIDQVLVDLDLAAGDNVLRVRLVPGAEPSFYFSPAPNAVAGLWTRIRRDFPPSGHPLLTLAHADWFGSDGWLGRRDASLEQRFIDQLAGACGPQERAIRARLDVLRQAKWDATDRRWLDLCVHVSVLATLHGESARLRAAVAALGALPSGDYPVTEFRKRLAGFERRLDVHARTDLNPTDEETRSLLAEMPRLRREMLVERNPLLRDARIVFVKRHTYDSKHYYDDFQHISAWGGNLCVLDLADGSVRNIASQLSEGVFDRYDISFDGRRILFGYRRPRREGFRIYEIGADGKGLRQVTRPPADEALRIERYGKTSTGDGFYGLLGYRFWTDDVHPCYLPDGDICFASTRSEHGVLCTPNHYLACTSLFRMTPDGRGIRPISHGALSEFTPTLMDDGRILYNRWEYVYKGIAAIQPLWVTRPDGSGSAEVYGNNVANPGVLWQARQVPGRPHRVVCIGCGHEPLGVGQVLLLDLRRHKRTAEPMVSLTPNVKTQNLRGLYQLRNGVWREDIYGPFYADPYPLSDQFFLVACNPDKRYNDRSAYGLHLLDVFGNRVPIYDDAKISCWQPMLLRARPRPPVLPAVDDPPPQSPQTAVVFLNDVYRGLEGVPRGTVKYLRVMEQVAKPWCAELDSRRGEDRRADGLGGHLAISLNTHIWVAVLHGITEVHGDGSALFEVPADRNIFFQALDEDFMEVQRMRTFVSFLPGERRSCIGCHEPRAEAPVSRQATALARAPAGLVAQPGEVAPRPLYYPADVQPILDRHCVRCHNRERPKPELDLRGDLTTMFSRSYEGLLQGSFVHTIREWGGATYAMQHAPAVAPFTYGSHRSKLVQMLRKGHSKVELSRQEWIRLVTWIDCGAPYYGSYYGRRNLRYRGQPDFRPVPTVRDACGAPPEAAPLPKPDPLPARLLAWWPMDDPAGGIAKDAGAGAHDAKAVAAERTDGQDGRGGRRFAGTGYLEGRGLGTCKAISIAMWVRAESLQHRWNPLLFGSDIRPGTVHFSLLTDGKPNIAIHSQGGNWTHRTGSGSLRQDRWQHVVLTCDGRPGGCVRFYIDGRLDGEHPLSLGHELDLSAFRIGAWNRWQGQAERNFHGEIDDVRVYTGTLTGAQVADIARGSKQ
jgi:hypothetical protein